MTEFAKDILLAVLAGGILFCLWEIWRMKKQLHATRRRQQLPVLTLAVEVFRRSIEIKNEGDCAAKDIRFEPFRLPLKYDFKRTLSVQFQPVELLGPRQQKKLAFVSFDNGHEVAAKEAEYVVTTLMEASYETQVSYSNMENIRFSASLLKDRDKIAVKEIHQLMGTGGS